MARFSKEYKIKNFFKPKDLISLANAGFGFLAILSMVHINLEYAAVFLVCAVFMDIIDGKVARRVGPTEYGKAIDIADTVSFGVAPALFITVWLKPNFSTFGLIVYASAFLLMMCGLVRLARFLVTDTKESIGLPITFNGIIFPALWFFNTPEIIVVIITLIVCSLMISSIRLPKV